ncbi:TPA: hypothetical protein N0F65_012043 [Lagenidium giganteum]|uniref:Uncharacterized protein n=1 Tax=Lagenidium giganteum TaxID=4803 RepID=A0AAV2YSF3_9STRA|nr:TPA: hypothetical protein N0F65_012043 [Lagenidium giganteum]
MAITIQNIFFDAKISDPFLGVLAWQENFASHNIIRVAKNKANKCVVIFSAPLRSIRYMNIR